MAKPIHIVRKRILTDEEIKQQSLDQLTDQLADSEEALHKTLAIVRELHESGMLEAVESLLKAKAAIAEIALGQATRKEVTNIMNNAMGAAAVLTEIDPEQTKKLLSSVASGLNEAKASQGKKVGLWDLLKVIKDPDVNRALGFGMAFLKGLGRGLK